MKIFELLEPQTVGLAAQNATVGGNAADLADPKIQAANLAQRNKEKIEQRRAIQQQIAALQKQLADINRTA